MTADILAHDPDPLETSEWLEALSSVVRHEGPVRGRFLMSELQRHALALGIDTAVTRCTPYTNTIPLAEQGAYPGDPDIENRITAIIRWNALLMVIKANQAYGDLGGHIASYSSAAEIFEIGFNHFFRGATADRNGDLLFLQPHSAPGVYARAYLEGRLSLEQISNFRREVGGNGLCSYPHPWLMPKFWQTPTGSMGIGPINAIYQARFLRYLSHRKLHESGDTYVWGVFGDGEMDEPESIGALSLAAREELDNLTFVINCNLQRLDGPVRGNGNIIQELEAIFSGAGWHVIKVLWGSRWDAIFALDSTGSLLRQLAITVDGTYQTLGANDGAYNLKNFFGLTDDLKKLVAHLSASEVEALERGGHDFRKLYAAFSRARSLSGKPTVILAKTKKGYGMGNAGEARMTSHVTKQLDIDSLIAFRDRFELPLSDADVAELKFLRPGPDSEEMRYLHERRRKLGGYVPGRRSTSTPVGVPPLRIYGEFALNANDKAMSTTMAFVRLFTNLLKHDSLGPRIVPIVADEARTVGLTALFRQVGIYSPQGQLYEPEDAKSLLRYDESKSGQILQEGITEAGALSSWVAAATSYSVNDYPMLPFYIFYSMFGFQRVGDLIWAAADQRARGFLIGATSGRTTLNGEGLQHQDGSSQLVASTVPNCKSYDPAFAYELAIIIDHGARRIMEENVDEFYYLTVTNEKCPQPSMPGGENVSEGVLRGLYKFRVVDGDKCRYRVRLVGSGAILFEVMAAAELLVADWGVAAEVWSAPSITELAREARDVERWNMLHPGAAPRTSHVARSFEGAAPVLVATDYVRAYAQQLAPYVNCPFAALGTDGFGRSDTRDALRAFFEVDSRSVVVSVLHLLARHDQLPAATLAHAIEKYRIPTDSMPPWQT